jgi:hypothetical protein
MFFCGSAYNWVPTHHQPGTPFLQQCNHIEADILNWHRVDLPDEAEANNVRLSLDDEYNFGSDDGENDSYHDDVDSLSDG